MNGDRPITKLEARFLGIPWRPDFFISPAMVDKLPPAKRSKDQAAPWWKRITG